MVVVVATSAFVANTLATTRGSGGTRDVMSRLVAAVRTLGGS